MYLVMGSWDDLQLHDDIVGYILDMRWQITLYAERKG